MESELRPSRIIQGLMRLHDLDTNQLYELIKFDLDHGINFFDLADIYVNGDSERKFGEVLKAHPELRPKMFIQTKGGIRKDEFKHYDLSKQHIIEACLASLKRCQLDYFDSYLLHRPDIFLDAEEIKEAFDYLYKNGYVKSFGVSNFSKEAVQYLLDAGIKLTTNQLQLGLGHLDLIRENINCNINNDEGTMRASDLFFFLKNHNISLQCWSPYQYGFMQGSIFRHEKMKACNEVMEELAQKYQTTKASIATAFLLNLHDNVYVVTGAINPKYVNDSIEALKIKLSRPDWYRLYCSTGNTMP